ncbi:MAG: DUF4139 domain-containing protein [Elusimicrobiota bacterium]
MKLAHILAYMTLQAIVCIPLYSAGSKTDASDQKSLEITVYNNNLALVKDVRNIRITSGILDLKFMDVASSIRPETVHIKSIDHGDKLAILEQNYEYDLMNTSKLLDKYIGKKIKLISYDNDSNPERTVDAKLLSNNDKPVYEINGEIHLGFPGYQILPEIPENLISRPTLVWLLDNDAGGMHMIEASYLTADINWKADYVMVLGNDNKTADFSGWVTINNKSGTAYNNAKLKLIAGDVHMAPGNYSRMGNMAAEADMSVKRAGGFREEGFFEYHLYTLERPSTLKNNQQKQISLLNVQKVAVEKRFIAESGPGYFMSRYGAKKQKHDVSVYVIFKNSKDSNLGMALPKGTVRMYREDSGGSLQFIGEDLIEHTPEDEQVRLKAGNAFDIVCERTQTDFNKLYDNAYETSWEVILKNHKDEDITVSVHEQLNGDWEIIESSHEYEKVDAFSVKFDIKIRKKDKDILKYKVRVRY